MIIFKGKGSNGRRLSALRNVPIEFQTFQSFKVVERRRIRYEGHEEEKNLTAEARRTRRSGLLPRRHEVHEV
jgi:hypothetical protein